MAALVEYPDGRTITVRPGAVLRDLGARVVSIDDGQIKFLLGAGQGGPASARTVVLTR